MWSLDTYIIHIYIYIYKIQKYSICQPQLLTFHSPRLPGAVRGVHVQEIGQARRTKGWARTTSEFQKISFVSSTKFQKTRVQVCLVTSDAGGAS